MSFRAVKRILNLQNIQEYRRFISTAPNIQNYIEFQDRKGDVSGFDYYIKPQFMEEVLADQKLTGVSQQQSGRPVPTVTPESVQHTSSNDNDAYDAIDVNTTLVTKVSSADYDNEDYDDNDSLTADTNKIQQRTLENYLAISGFMCWNLSQNNLITNTPSNGLNGSDTALIKNQN